MTRSVSFTKPARNYNCPPDEIPVHINANNFIQIIEDKEDES